MKCEKFHFESKYGGDVTLIAFDNERLRLRSGPLAADGHRIDVTEYETHDTVSLWTENDHLVTSINVEKYVGRRIEVEASRMQSKHDS